MKNLGTIFTLCLFLISLILVVGFVILPAQAAEPPQLQLAPMRQPPEQPPPVIDGHGTGFIPPPMDLSHLTGQEMPERFMAEQPPLGWPLSYDCRAQGWVTSVKNQGLCGSCYAFAAVAQFESRNLIDGAYTLPLPNYSENNAKECNWREQNNYQNPPGTYWGSCDGGNYYMLASLWSQAGVVLDSYDPYVASDVACLCFDTCPYQQTLLGWSIISGNAVPNPDVLKGYIYQYGPIYTSMYAGDGSNPAWYSEFGSYDGSYVLSYPSCPYGTNHAVLFVGWDDSLGSAGAWIVKNSWGNGWGGTCGYGTEGGYFTIAYGSANIGMYSSYMYDWQWYNPGSGIMYYDDDYWTALLGCGTTTGWGLCRFTPPTNTYATRVEFWTTDQTTDVDVYLYDGFDGTTLSNKLWESLDNSFPEAGYHGVVVNAPLPLTAGDDVFAVVKFTNNSYTMPIPADGNGPYETGRTYASCTGGPGSWVDVGPTFNYDVAIRLRTAQPKPDLVVSKSIEFSGGNFTVSYNVTNIGNATAGNSTTCKYLNGIFEESQPCPALAPGESYNGTFAPEPCPCGQAFNVTVCADNNDVVTESNETNNCEINILECPPDLVITEKSEEWVDFDVGTYNITYTVANQGCSAAGASNTTITIDSIDVLEDPVSTLAAGANYSNTVGPFTMSGNSDNITVCADNGDVVAESDETNNCQMNTLECPPDLVITEKSEEWVDFGAKTYNITYTVTNQGCVAAAASNTTITIDGTDVLEDPVLPLAAGANYSNTVGPFTMSGNSDNITVCADNGDVVAESDETNNCQTNTIGLMEGDTTLNGCVSLSDAMFIAQYAVGSRAFTADQLTCGDTTDDNAVSLVDAMHTAQWVFDVAFKPLWESPDDDHMLEPVRC